MSRKIPDTLSEKGIDIGRRLSGGRWFEFTGLCQRNKGLPPQETFQITSLVLSSVSP
jgi:hypothetical protein